MTTKEKIIKTINEIPETRYRELFDLVEDFKKKTGSSGSVGKWDEFFGMISDEQAEAMLAAIEQECEVIENGD